MRSGPKLETAETTTRLATSEGARDLTALFDEAQLAALQAHPNFRRACEEVAAAGVEQFVELDADYRWLMKDLGRTAICLTALILASMEGGLSGHALNAACRANDVASPGRVSAVVERLLRIGDLTVEPGPGHWTRRRMTLGPRFVDALRSRGRIDLASLPLIAPETAGLSARLDDPQGFIRYTWHVGLYSSLRRDLFAFSTKGPTDFFMIREAGMLVH